MARNDFTPVDSTEVLSSPHPKAVTEHFDDSSPKQAAGRHGKTKTPTDLIPGEVGYARLTDSIGFLCGVQSFKSLVWKSHQGPLVLNGTVILGPGTTLTLEAGTKILVGASDSCPEPGTTPGGRNIALVVRGGTLKVLGKPRNPVLFKPLAKGKGFLWQGILAQRASLDQNATLRWIELSDASVGISFVAGAGRVEHAVIERCGIGISSMMGASPSIHHCVISGSVLADVVSSHSSTRIRSSIFVDGHGDGIRFDGIGLSKITTSCFWNHSGTDLLRPPRTVGDWKGDSVPDPYGNLHCDPIFRGSASHEQRMAQDRQKGSKQPWWKPYHPPTPPPGWGPWALSPFSPLLDKGEGPPCFDPDHSHCDIGLWSGL